MRPTYTCQRCLAFMRGSSLKLRSVGPAADIRRNFISVHVGQASRTRPNKDSTSLFKSYRSVSSLGNQGDGLARYKSPNATPPIDLQRAPEPEDTTRELLRPNNLFHPFSESPSPDIRRRAAFIKQHAYCPHPAHRQTRIAGSPN